MARSLNRVLIIGNVGKDPESRYTSNGTCVVNFSVATNRRKQDPNGEWVDEVEWHRIVAWEKQAEYMQQYGGKGQKVFVEGRLQTRKWTDNQGVQRYSTEIVAHDIIGLTYADGEESEAAPVPARQAAPRRRPERAEGGWADEDLDEVPF